MTSSTTQVQASPWWLVVAVGRNPRRTVVRILVLLAVIVFTWKFAFLPIRVQGISMMPTYLNNQVNVINRLAYVLHPPKRGDVVGIRYDGEKVLLLKRIVGLPGDTVGFRGGRLYVNGQLLDEPYLKLSSNWSSPPDKVGLGEYYVVGDNRSMNEIDHTHGLVDRADILGKTLR